MKQVGAQNGVFAKYISGATFMIPTHRVLDKVVQMIIKSKWITVIPRAMSISIHYQKLRQQVQTNNSVYHDTSLK